MKTGSLGKHRTRTSHGYVMCYVPLHPKSHINGYVYEHILVVEKIIGRYLNSKEQVHHKNKNKSDNRIENLQLCESQLEHIRYEFGWEKINKKWFKNCCHCKKLLDVEENFYLRADKQTRFYICKKCCAEKHRLKKLVNKK